MNNNYLTDSQIHDMAQAALNSYELTADWVSAKAAAAEYAIDELGIKPRKSAVLLALRIAQTGWHSITLNVKREMAQGAA
jgi:hypothetical protein